MNEEIVRNQGYVGGMTSAGFMSKVMPVFSLGLLMTAAGAYLGWDLPIGFRFGAVIVSLIMIFASNAWAYREQGNLNIGLFLVFATLNGITLVTLLQWALAISGPGIIVQALGATVITFAGISAYGAVTKRDFSGIGGFLIITLLGLIIASIVNIFIGGTMMALVISVISVGVFSAFILYDMAIIRRSFSDRDYIVASLMLYLDFILLFQNILQILGILNSRD